MGNNARQKFVDRVRFPPNVIAKPAKNAGQAVTNTD